MIFFLKYKRLLKSIIPLASTMFFLGFNTYYFHHSASQGPHQIALLLGAFITWLLHPSDMFNRKKILKILAKNISTMAPTFFFLLAIATMSVTWLISGVTPSIIYYGISYIEPKFFLLTATLFCALVSVGMGSSWATIATLGLPLLETGKALGWSSGIIGGAIISGAYFGDKISPLSETTIMAASVTDTKLFYHIRAMLWTSIPTFIATLLIFFIIGFSAHSVEIESIHMQEQIMNHLAKNFTISPILFLAPIFVFLLIIGQISPLITLFLGSVMGILTIFIVQPPILSLLWEEEIKFSLSIFIKIFRSIFSGIKLTNENALIPELFKSSGIIGIIPTITLIFATLIMSTMLEITKVIETLTEHIVGVDSIGSLTLMTSIIGVLLNSTIADQYLAIILGGKICSPIFIEKKINRANLSRSLEDSITVTSPLVPWNTCGLAQSAMLDISTFTYLPYSFFNILSPIIGVAFAYMKIGIVKTPEKKSKIGYE